MTRLSVPFFRPDIAEPEIEELVEAVRSGWLTTGPRVKRFEKGFREAVGARHAVAVNSATAARLPVLGLAAIYLLADAAAAVVETRRQGANPALLALVFPILHVAYGAGFLVELVRFVGRWRSRAPSAAQPEAR